MVVNTRHRAVSLRQHGFLVLQRFVKAGVNIRQNTAALFKAVSDALALIDLFAGGGGREGGNLLP